MLDVHMPKPNLFAVFLAIILRHCNSICLQGRIPLCKKETSGSNMNFARTSGTSTNFSEVLCRITCCQNSYYQSAANAVIFISAFFVLLLRKSLICNIRALYNTDAEILTTASGVVVSLPFPSAFVILDLPISQKCHKC
ncbi:hypothetical protein Pelo_3156 [Pelomyxa schiedti]|nr:hypothetical protein Pelo_3156 [Pelomyxa schiedti]